MARPGGLARMRFSSGSLQLDEEEEGEEEEEAVKEKANTEGKGEDQKKGDKGGDEAKSAPKLTEVTL